MPLVNKQKDESLGAIRVSNEIHSRGEAALAKILGQSEGIKRPIPARLGSVVTGELFVPDTNNARVYISGQGDEPNTLGTIPSVNIPKEFLKFGQPIEVRKQPNGSFKYAGVDTSTGEIFNEGNTDEPDQSPVTQSQLDFASLQPYNGLTATVKGAIYGDYAVRDLVTADFSASPLDTSSVAINIPTTANRAIGVLVQLDPSTSTLSYKQSSEFNGGLSLSAAYALDLLPLRDAGKWRVGYLKLSTGITQFDYASVWTCAEFFPNAVRGSVGANDNRLARTDGTSGTGIQGSTVTLDDEGDLSSLTSLSYSDATELTIASGAVTVLQSYHKIDTEANAASDDLDTISGGRAGMELYLRAEDGARTVVIRHNGGGTGNIRTPDTISISLDESYKVVKLLYDGTNWNVVSGGGGGSSAFTVAGSSGTPQTISNGDTLTIAAGANITTTASATDTVTIAATGLASTTLNNLGTVALNTSIISDTDNTDDLGSSAVKFRAAYSRLLYLHSLGSTPSTPSAPDIVVYANADGQIATLGGTAIGARNLSSFSEITSGQLGSNQTTITFSSIPEIYQDLLLVISTRSTSTGANINVTFNSDTGTNYAKNSSQFTAGAVESHVVSHNQNNIACVNAVVPSTGTTGYMGSLWFYIRSYQESQLTRSGHYSATAFTNATSLTRSEGTFAWENVSAAITTIALNQDAGDFATDTIYALYGIGTSR